MDEIVVSFEVTSGGAIWFRWPCTTCGETNESDWDPSGGEQQEYVEDCSVCCRPNVLSITVDPVSSTAHARITPEYR